MIRIALAAALLAAVPTPSFAQSSPAPEGAQAPTPKEDLVPVAIETSLGRIVVALDRARAPITTANFLKYVDTRRLDGQTFYRAMPATDGSPVLIQGGVTSDARKLLPPIKHEPTTQTGLKNLAGAISMANAGPGTARSDFFILLADQPGFDAGAESGDAGFAVFGHVTEGMDVVRKIYQSPTSATKGEGVMKGQMLASPVKIIKAARVK
jgi:peptidyl-prolyl cis-trans isomerase A (cyclophilin A)